LSYGVFSQFLKCQALANALINLFFQSHLLASCRSALDLVSHYHERVRTHPTKGRKTSDKSTSTQAEAAEATAAYDNRVSGAKARMEKLQELMKRRKRSIKSSERRVKPADEDR
jgi:chromosome segregation ATPase